MAEQSQAALSPVGESFAEHLNAFYRSLPPEEQKPLIEHATEQARAGGVRFLSIGPAARNVDALAFFVRASFDIVAHVDLFQDLSRPSTRRWKSGITLHGRPLGY